MQLSGFRGNRQLRSSGDSELRVPGVDVQAWYDSECFSDCVGGPGCAHLRSAYLQLRG